MVDRYVDFMQLSGLSYHQAEPSRVARRWSKAFAASRAADWCEHRAFGQHGPRGAAQSRGHAGSLAGRLQDDGAYEGGVQARLAGPEHAYKVLGASCAFADEPPSQSLTAIPWSRQTRRIGLSPPRLLSNPPGCGGGIRRGSLPVHRMPERAMAGRARSNTTRPGRRPVGMLDICSGTRSVT